MRQPQFRPKRLDPAVNPDTYEELIGAQKKEGEVKEGGPRECLIIQSSNSHAVVYG